MSYQEYSQLGRNNRRNTAQLDEHNGASRRALNQGRPRTERPYTGSFASFSHPRRSVTPGHSSSASTTSSLSPSNSASQKGFSGGAGGNQSPTNSQWSAGSSPAGQLPNGALKSSNLINEKKPELIDVPMSWRPSYLRRKILASFTVIVTGLAVSIGALYDTSNKNIGLGPTRPAGHYLWRFAPTAVLTLLAALWSRVDYQAKLVAPWVRLSKGPARAEKTLLLDYHNMSQPVAVVRALQEKDFAVACTAAATILLRVLVALSTGLITLSLVSGIPGAPSNTSSRSNMDVTVETSFVDNTTDMTNAGALAFFTMVGLQQEDVYPPAGVSERFAYQRFSSDLPQGSIVETTVDGFAAGLQCEVGELSLAEVVVNRGIQQFDTSFSGGGCNIKMPISSEGFVPKASGSEALFFFARLGRGSCGDSGRPEDERIVAVFGTGTIDGRSESLNSSLGSTPVPGEISRSAQIICRPTYSIIRVDVTVQDSTLLNITESRQGQDRTLASVEPWDLAEAFFSSYRRENELASLYADSSPWFYQPNIVNVDAAMFLALELQLGRAGSPIPLEKLFDTTVLQAVANEYFQQYAAVLASRSLTQPTSISVPATASTMSERLKLSPLIAKVMIILMGVTAVLSAAAAFAIPKSGILPRDPGTIMDMAALVSNSRCLLRALRGAGGADLATLRARLVGSQFYTGVEAYERAESTGSGYFKIFGGQDSQDTTAPEYVKQTEKFSHPPFLHPIQRGAAFLITIGLIVGLDLGYQSSTRNGGLADADDDTYPHLLWTVVPAVGVGLTGLYFIVADFTIRTLAPFAALRRGATFEQSIGLNVVDAAVPVVLYRALRTSRNLVVGGATLAALFSSLFVIFTGTLFSVATVPATAQCQLLTRDFFSQSSGVPGDGFCTFCQNGTVLSSLVLDANMSYPAFTFEDLAYPSFSLENVPDDMELPDDLVVNAVVPAVRSSLQCQSFRQSVLATDLQTGSSVNGVMNPLRITLPGNAEVDENTMTISTAQNLDSFGNPLNTAIDRNAFFGAGDYKPVAEGNSTVARWVWVWGQLQDAGTDQTKVQFVAALTCNETMQQVNVATSFIGSDLHIDAEYKPPVPDEATVTSVPVAIDGNLDYSELIQLHTPHLLDPFFSSLVSSRFAIPVTSLGSSGSNGADEVRSIQSVADAIMKQHKIIRAQIVSTWNRRGTVPPTSSTGAAQPQSVIFPVDSAGVIMGNATTLAFPAVLTVSNLESGAARRVVQDMISTRILQALLSATLIAAAASWLAWPKPNTILPRPPTSIASVVALLADGNLFGLLGRGAEWLSLQDLSGFFKDGLHVSMGFQLEWERLRRRRREQTLATYGMNGSCERDEVFGISAIRTGGWGGGENVGLGLQARVGYAHRSHVRDWGWRT